MSSINETSRLYREKNRTDLLLKPVAAKYALRLSDIELVLFMGSNPGSHTAGEAAERQYLPKSVISSSVERLTEGGYITACCDINDKRRVLLTLTPEGNAIVSDIRCALSACEKYCKEADI